MYLHLGRDVAVKYDTIIGIFDFDTSTHSHLSRRFFTAAQKRGQVVVVTDELPKAFVLTREFTLDRVYLTQFSAATIEKRSRRGK